MDIQATRQQISLRWNNFVCHLSGIFKKLRDDNNLVDVTLSCEGKLIKAHKLLLSSCSAYFRMIFDENPCQHPVIVFQNVKYDDLLAIINFMYLGEVTIIQERLESFLSTAELLKVEGLIGNDDQDEMETSNQEFSDDIGDTIILDETLVPNKANHSSVNTLDGEKSAEKSMDITEEHRIIEIIDNTKTGEIGEKQDEVKSTVFQCQLCPKEFKHPISLTLHKDSHTGKTQCPICRRSFSRRFDMKNHLLRIHKENKVTIKRIASNLTINDK